MVFKDIAKDLLNKTQDLLVGQIANSIIVATSTILASLSLFFEYLSKPISIPIWSLTFLVFTLSLALWELLKTSAKSKNKKDPVVEIPINKFEFDLLNIFYELEEGLHLTTQYLTSKYVLEQSYGDVRATLLKLRKDKLIEFSDFGVEEHQSAFVISETGALLLKEHYDS